MALPKPETVLLMTVREALIIVLGALEDFLNIDRSIVPRRKRQREGGSEGSPR